MTYRLINGDCLEKLKELKDNSVDSIVTDPPYGLSFMGKSWDYDVPKTEVWAECLRVLKPGGHLLSFFGTRTYHRGVVRIEDAGFEIRDMVSWLYGSGFPKSLNIGKKIDQIQGNEREDLGKHPNARETVGNINICKKNGSGRLTKGNSKYEGYGTALKPSNEPIVLARKPLSEKNIALNVLKWGTGGINIDGCRVSSNEDMSSIKAFGGMPESKVDGKGFDRPWMKDKNKILEKQNRAIEKMKEQGRFPANLIHDGSKEVVDKFPMTKSGSGKKCDKNIVNKNYGIYGKCKPTETKYYNGDSGSASRFFKTCEYTEADRIYYVPKASKAERNAGLEGFEEKNKSHITSQNFENALTGSGNVRKITHRNNHPTVKPIKLMQYLVRLITPKGGTVLDPYMGSGTTGIACKKENFKFIGIEREEEYIKIAKARINSIDGEKVTLIKEEIKEETKEDVKPIEKKEAVKPTLKTNTKECDECGGKIKAGYCEDCLKDFNK